MLTHIQNKRRGENVDKREAENKHIIGTPGIDYEDDLKGEDGILLPGKDVGVKDGTSFSVDPEHVS